MNIITVVVLMIFSTLAGSVGSLFLKKCASKFSLHPFRILKDKNLILGVFFYAISTLSYIFLLRSTSLNILYPLTALGYIWILFLSKKYLNEEINKYKWVGIMLIIIGITLIVR